MNTGRLHLLIMEDEAAHVEAIRRAFDKDGAAADIHAIGSLRAYRERIAAQPPDLALIDLNLPDGRAVDVLTHPPEDAPFPVLVMTAFGNQEIAVDVMKAGALDYVVKSPEAFAGIPQVVERALREWKLLQDRKRAEAALRESQQIINGILDAMPVRIFWKDGNLVYQGCNLAFARDAGFDSPQDIIGKDDFQMGWRVQAEKYRGDDRQVMEGGCAKLLIEEVLTRPDGKTMTLLTSKVPLCDSRGGIVGLLGTYLDITERKHAEEALRASNEMLALFMQHSPIYTYIKTVTPAGSRVLLASDNFRELTGIAASDMVGKTMAELFPADMAMQMDTDDWTVVSGGRVLKLDEDLNGRNYTTIKFPIVREGKTLLAGYTIDITERVRAEAALHASEEQFRVAQELSPDGFAILRPVRDTQGRAVDFTWVYENAAVARLNGTDPKAVVGRRLLELFPGYRDSPSFRAYQQVAETGKSCIVEDEYGGESMLKDTCLRIVVVPMGGDIAVLAQDNTERNRAENRARQSHELLANLSRLVPGVVYQYRLYPDGRSAFPYSSPGMNDIYEVTPEEVRDDASPVFGRLHPDDYGRVGDLIQESARTLRTFHCEYRVILPRQGLRWRWSQAQPERMEDGGTLWHGIISDITDLKQAEQRTQMFSQEILAAREEERRQVAAVLHHDVGSLAVGISAHLDTIEDDLRAGKPGDAIKRLKLTRKLFGKSVARLKNVAAQLRPPELDVIGLRAALRQHFSQITKARGTEVCFRETMGRKRVSGDTATILFRIAQEALTNALRHGHAKRVDVSLDLSKGNVTLTVSDNGKGFDSSKKGPRPRPQMGLRVMREMAASAGGTLTIDSARGQGTTVRASLPFVPAPKAGGA